MDWEDIKFHLHTMLLICASSIGFGLVGILVARALP